jgi:hypothetical protein
MDCQLPKILAALDAPRRMVQHLELIDEKGVVVATFNEAHHHYGTTLATVKLRAALGPFTIQGTEDLAIFAKGINQPFFLLEASCALSLQNL